MDSLGKNAVVVFICLMAGTASLAQNAVDILSETPANLPRIKDVRAVTRGPKHHFFGYYAICPWDPTGRDIVCMETDFGDRDVAPDDRAGICLVNVDTGEIRRIAETTAWNFQQGALVHWLGGGGEKRRIVFNDVVSGKLKARVLDVDWGEERVLPRAITSVAHNGKTAACISFGRLNHTRPGYGYPGVDDPYKDQPHPADDGLFIMDIETGETHLAVSYKDVFEAAPPPEDHTGQTMWFNLVIFSRDARHVAFLSRYKGIERGWYTALFTVNVDGSELRCVLPYDWGCSHFDWVDADRLVATTRYKGKLWCHCLFTNGKDDHRPVAPSILKQDGHCHASWDGRWMVTDSYPTGSRRMQHFYVMDMRNEEVALLARFHEPEQYHGHWRCDLHPRWSRDCRSVCIDSTHNGTRQVYVVDLAMPENLKPEKRRSAGNRSQRPAVPRGVLLDAPHAHAGNPSGPGFHGFRQPCLSRQVAKIAKKSPVQEAR